jgi:hypothetical protein
VSTPVPLKAVAGHVLQQKQQQASAHSCVGPQQQPQQQQKDSSSGEEDPGDEDAADLERQASSGERICDDATCHFVMFHSVRHALSNDATPPWQPSRYTALHLMWLAACCNMVLPLQHNE